MKWSLNIADGRRFFWQWDTGCLLNVGGISEGSELHFANSAFPEPLKAKTFKKGSDVLCKVPDEILQTSGRFYVFVYMCEEENGYTVYEKSFVVNPKPKPVDYVYEETERYTVERAIEEAFTAKRSDFIKFTEYDPDISIIEAINRNFSMAESAESGIKRVFDELNEAINGVEEDLRMINEGGIE